MSGDQVALMAESYYTPPTEAVENNKTLAVDELLRALTSSGMVTGIKGAVSPTEVYNANSSTATNYLQPFLQTPAGGLAVNAHLNWILFDEQMKFVSGGSHPVNPLGGYQLHTANVPVTKNGYLYIYVSNQSNQVVYFDNLALTHTKGPILEEAHYYPFGLTMHGISSKALGGFENKIGYNSNESQQKEFSNGIGLEWYDFNARTYVPQLGRFMQVDPLNEEGGQESMTPYHFGFNNPVRYNDPDGRFPFPVIPLLVKGVEFVVIATVGYFAAKESGEGLRQIKENIDNSRSNKQPLVQAKANKKDGGIVYERIDKNGVIPDPYVGQAKSGERYAARQKEHARANPKSDFDFKIIDRGDPGKDLDNKEQQALDARGGPKNKSNPNGGTSNRKNVIKKNKKT